MESATARLAPDAGKNEKQIARKFEEKTNGPELSSNKQSNLAHTAVVYLPAHEQSKTVIVEPPSSTEYESQIKPLETPTQVESEGQTQGGTKRKFVEDLSTPDTNTDKKQKLGDNNQQFKRYKYDLLQAFFRVYFQIDKEGMVLKDAVYNLYCKKIQEKLWIARNALYRHMWGYYKDKVSTFQSNYRDYIRGLTLRLNNSTLNYEGFEKDLALLKEVGVEDPFDFYYQDIQKPESGTAATSTKPSTSTAQQAQPQLPPIPSLPILAEAPAILAAAQEKFGVASQYMDEPTIVSYIEGLESTAKNLVAALEELKSKLAMRKPAPPTTS